MLSSPAAKKRRTTGRRSCTECIKAKRRCDQGITACLRCTKQKLECRFPTNSVASTSSAPSPGSLFSDSALTVTSTAINEHNEQDLALDWSQFSSVLQDHNFGALDFTGSDHLSGGCLDSFSGMEDLLNPSVDTTMAMIRPSSTNLTIPPVVDSSSSELAAAISSRLDYGMAQLKRVPSKMVLQKQTPWCHPLLYEDIMPRSMQDVFASCALYQSKNETNSKFIFRYIEERVRELITSPTPSAPLEILARTQAFILYQLIRVFDGDISARAQADRDFPLLEPYTFSLQSIMTEEEEDPGPILQLYPTGPTKAIWKSWILRESARRTYLICFYFLSFYTLLQDKSYCRDHPPISTTWTASAHLWHASTVYHFAVAWKEKRHFVIRDLDYTDLLADANADDIDEYGRILIVSSIGIDDARGWFYTRGGLL
ncbi:hypothetical protein CPB83DRAFT_883240 [Crepidotus variabilis]|uniref:Zn(2)-C6 fungal-type domain-containing protein n=1 Tax=Crepidotus variabilis TaxID=179855 RepID=A0A9P6EH36_9AGAR|nr:hypothetical protein CPB83DRAFT_883240 [Crepidotus variabilis]